MLVVFLDFYLYTCFWLSRFPLMFSRKKQKCKQTIFPHRQTLFWACKWAFRLFHFSKVIWLQSVQCLLLTIHLLCYFTAETLTLNDVDALARLVLSAYLAIELYCWCSSAWAWRLGTKYWGQDSNWFPQGLRQGGQCMLQGEELWMERGLTGQGGRTPGCSKLP